MGTTHSGANSFKYTTLVAGVSVSDINADGASNLEIYSMLKYSQENEFEAWVPSETQSGEGDRTNLHMHAYVKPYQKDNQWHTAWVIHHPGSAMIASDSTTTYFAKVGIVNKANAQITSWEVDYTCSGCSNMATIVPTQVAGFQTEALMKSNAAYTALAPTPTEITIA